MGHNDVDHLSLGKVRRAKTMGELAEIAKSCGYDLSDACLSGMPGSDPCQRNVCMEFTKF